MAESAKSKIYHRHLANFFKRANKANILYPTYSGYTPWNDGYQAGYLAGKIKGIKIATETNTWLRTPSLSSPPRRA